MSRVIDYGNVFLALPSVGVQYSKIFQREMVNEKIVGRAVTESRESSSKKTIAGQVSRSIDQLFGQHMGKGSSCAVVRQIKQWKIDFRSRAWRTIVAKWSKVYLTKGVVVCGLFTSREDQSDATNLVLYPSNGF